MKKFLLCTALAAGCCLASSAQSKINNVGRIQMEKFADMRSEMARKSPARAAAFNPSVSVIATLTGENMADELRNAGFNVISSVADMAIVSVEMDRVEELSELDIVRYVDFGTTARPLMDMARAASGVDACHNGSDGLTTSYKGEGVICGIYDTGLDPNHANFTGHSGARRVQGVHVVRNYGENITSHLTDEEIKTFTTEDRTQTHGTHVLGIMAGRNDVQGTYGVKNGATVSTTTGSIPYYGVAPESDIIIGCGDFDTYSINAGVEKVISHAKQIGKPVVVNMSIGHNRGSHDPRETANVFLDKLSKDAVICVAAGNEGGTKMSVERTCRGNASMSKVNTFLVPTYSSTAYSLYSAEFWSDDATPFTAELVMYNLGTKAVAASFPLKGESGTATWKASEDAVFKQAYETSSQIRASWGVDKATGRYNLQLECTMTPTGAVNIMFAVNIQGNDGQKINGYCDAYAGSEIEFSSEGVSGYLNGSDKGSINGMACGYNTISVGAYVTRTQMPTAGGSSQTQDAGGIGKIADFSSYGSSGDGRQLPIVCAPGAQIISSVSRYWAEGNGMGNNTLNAVSTENGRNSHWYYLQGTSMACPFVAGSVALWLQACPTLTYKEVQNLIATTSTKDANTTPSAKWGAGKINTLAGLKAAIELNASISTTLADRADENLLVAANDGKQFEISVPGVNNISCALYSLQGAEVAAAATSGDTVNLDASSLNSGIYLLSVNAAGQKLSRKLVVK